MNYKKHTHSNGLRVLIAPMPSMESATLTVWTKVGSRQESDKIAGISHFLEHMVFKGSKKRPTAKDISEAVDGFGGEFNAGTSKEWTNFYIKSRSQTLDEAFDVLSDMIIDPILRQEDIDREKGVIVEEIAMYEDTPMYHIGDIFEQLVFQGSTLGRDIIGFRKTVKALKRADFVNYRKLHYTPKNMLLCVSGGVTEKQVLELAKKYFSKIPLRSLDSARDFVGQGKFKNTQTKPQVKLVSKKNEQAHLIMGFVSYERGHKRRHIEAVLAAILGGGMSSRLFTEVREKRGLAYSVRTTTDHYLDTGVFNSYAGVDVKKVDEAISVMLEQHYAIANSQLIIDNSELQRAKEYIKGHLALSLEDTKNVNYFFGEEELFLGKIETPDEIFKKIDGVTVQDVVNLAKELFVPERLNLAIIGPYKEAARFQKLLEL